MSDMRRRTSGPTRGPFGQILWEPSAEAIARAQVTAFREGVNARHGLALADQQDLWEWSVHELAGFWAEVWRFGDVRASRTWESVLVDPDLMPGARWFIGARLNFAENLLRRRDQGEALVYRGEGEVGSRRLSFAELHEQVRRLAAGLQEVGIGPGDVVAGILPNLPETVIAMLAAASLGAVWTSCSPDFGVQGVVDRLGQTRPRLLLAADGYVYGGRTRSVMSRLREIVGLLPSVERVVIVPHLEAAPDPGQLAGAGHASIQIWDTFMAQAPDRPLDFAQLPFAHPLYIMYSSGTTGLPKAIIHSAGGTLLQHLKEHLLHGDLRAGERIFYYTTCGWMMWNWLVSALATGATVLLYDGAPLTPRSTLWDYAQAEGINTFGVSARYLAACKKSGLRPRASHDLSGLKTILSTGSPLAPASFDYVYQDVKADVRLSSISGGTDIISCFALGSPVLPVRRGELQCRGLGMKVAVYDSLGDEGIPPAQPAGEAAGLEVVGRPGELVCTSPFPSLPIGFWNDPDGSRYRAAYFERWPGVWHHGDWAELRPEGGMVIHGRSDAVLNPGGVRIGTAEIYRIVERFDEISGSLAVGQEWQGDTRVILFLRLREGAVLDQDLRERIKRALREEASPRHVPAKIIAVGDIPRTLSGKIVEVAVREVIHGRPVRNADALANPEALELFRDLPELERG
jgi:acetoacetyl-CoA synthetase